MTTQDIINKFEQLVDDTTELSTSEELALAEKIYRKVLNNRQWEFLKKQFTGSTNGTDYVILPSDFAYPADNYNYTDNTIETVHGSRPCVVFVGDNYQPYRVVNFSDRMQYRNNTNVCWFDIVNNKLMFATTQTSGKQVIFDYIYNPEALTTGTSPVFPSRFHDIIAHGMAADDFAIQLFDKSKSYQKENEIQYASYLADMAYYNSQLNQN